MGLIPDWCESVKRRPAQNVHFIAEQLSESRPEETLSPTAP